MLNTIARKFILAVLISYGSVVWLSEWHQYGYSRSPLQFPPVSSWLRDSMIVFAPVMLAVWVGTVLAQWLIGRSNGRMSASTQSILTAAILAGFTTIAVILTEGNRIILTGIGNELSFVASICNRLYPKGNLLLNFIKWLIPDVRALRIHFFVQDGINLVLVNLVVTILLIILLEGFERVRERNSYAHETG